MFKLLLSSPPLLVFLLLTVIRMTCSVVGITIVFRVLRRRRSLEVRSPEDCLRCAVNQPSRLQQLLKRFMYTWCRKTALNWPVIDTAGCANTVTLGFQRKWLPFVSTNMC
jgi:hypothetical protein